MPGDGPAGAAPLCQPRAISVSQVPEASPIRRATRVLKEPRGQRRDRLPPAGRYGWDKAGECCRASAARRSALARSIRRASNRSGSGSSLGLGAGCDELGLSVADLAGDVRRSGYGAQGAGELSLWHLPGQLTGLGRKTVGESKVGR